MSAEQSQGEARGGGIWASRTAAWAEGGRGACWGASGYPGPPVELRGGQVWGLRTQGSSRMRLRKEPAASAWRGWRASLKTPLEETVVKCFLEGR